MKHGGHFLKSIIHKIINNNFIQTWKLRMLGWPSAKANNPSETTMLDKNKFWTPAWLSHAHKTICQMTFIFILMS
jgi:hypothetical protein